MEILTLIKGNNRIVISSELAKDIGWLLTHINEHKRAGMDSKTKNVHAYYRKNGEVDIYLNPDDAMCTCCKKKPVAGYVPMYGVYLEKLCVSCWKKSGIDKDNGNPEPVKRGYHKGRS